MGCRSPTVGQGDARTTPVGATPLSAKTVPVRFADKPAIAGLGRHVRSTMLVLEQRPMGRSGPVWQLCVRLRVSAVLDDGGARLLDS